MNMLQILQKNEEALIHAHKYCENNFNFISDIMLNLQPTSPLRLDFLIDKCIEKYDNGGYDSLLTARKETPFIWQEIDGKWKYTVDKHNCCDRKMRQEFKKSDFLWHDCGSIYIMDVRMLLETECRIGKNPCIFPVDNLNSIQIDTEFDFDLIENIVKTKKINNLI